MNHSYDFLILYATQTGTSQYLSESLYRDCFKHNLVPKLLSIDQYPIETLPSEKIIIFLISTTGQGEPTTSMQSFWHFLLLKDLPLDVLEGLKFTIFGLGDSVYPQFNAMARKLFQRLLQLGAKPFHDRGLGDDSNPLGHYAEFDPWTENLWKSLQKVFPERKVLFSEEELRKFDEKIEPPSYLIEFLGMKGEGNLEKKGENIEEIKEAEEICQEILDQELPEPSHSLKFPCSLKNKGNILKFIQKTALTSPESEKTVVKLDFHCPEGLVYDPGDIALLQPRNDPESAGKLALLLGLNPREWIKLTPNPYYSSHNDHKFPKKLTIQDLFETFLDVKGVPTRFFFRTMSFFTEDELHKEKLNEMGVGKKNENIEDYYNYCVRERRNVYEVLYDFNTVKLPLEYLVDSVQILKPREFSISSSLKVHKNQMSLTVALVSYKTRLNRQIHGVCSDFFRRIEKGQNALVWIKKGSMKFPSGDEPTIMIGPGTGISPFIGFLEERDAKIQEKAEVLNGKSIVFFGCRNEKMDYLYSDYLISLQKRGVIQLFTAFSRDQESKIYVQNRIRENGKMFADLIIENMENIRIFVSGTAKYMPQQVKEALLEILRERCGDMQTAKSIINSLQKKGHFVIEAW